ncbi:hypothetical protein Pcinc_019080 [Petrolisthes cinctipes]|uniref:Pro-resilin n=1 Tax=Petrolisthes cinctipes TaxID=88211 RepID=A0AAE1FKU8_PETCI|nr:hypothetical protein Pcinc_019080 [Petrolisthes cinctipes]
MECLQTKEQTKELTPNDPSGLADTSVTPASSSSVSITCIQEKVMLTLLLLAGVTLVSARPDGSFGRSSESYGDDDDDYGSDSGSYSFEWDVSDEYSNNHYGHQERSDGDRTEGHYRTLLPDGRLLTVTYYVDGYSGFVPEVNFEGDAHYDSGSYSNEYDSDSDEYEYRGRR